MRIFLLILSLVSIGCQRLRLEVDDLRLRCGEDAHLLDVAQWIEPFSDYGKPKAGSVRAAAIGDDLHIEKLPVSSKGCIAVPVGIRDWRWLGIRLDEGGAFGKVLLASPERYRRVILEAVPGSFPRFDCPKASTGDQLPVNLVYQDHWGPENLRLRMELSDGKGVLSATSLLELTRETGGPQLIDLRQVAEGAYDVKLRLLNLLNFTDDLKGFERTCPLQIDRTIPKLKLSLRNGKEYALDGSSLRLGPGETLDIKVDDQSTTRVYSCWIDKSSKVSECKDFVEAGTRISAPNQGEWKLLIYATDGAGNKTEVQSIELVVFDADRVGRLVGWIDEAKLYLKQESYFEALRKIYQALRSASELKSASEANYVREQARLTVMAILGSPVPINSIAVDEGTVEKLWGVSGDRFISLVAGERRLGRILKLYELSGKILKRLLFEDESQLAFDVNTKNVLVWRPDGGLELYDADLKLIKNGRADRAEKASLFKFSGPHVLIKTDSGFLYANLDMMSTEQFAVADMSVSGAWLVHQSGDGIDLRNLMDGHVTHKTVEGNTEELRFASLADMLCLKQEKHLRCAEPQGFIDDAYDLYTDDAAGRFVIQPLGKMIGHEADGKLLLFNAIDRTYYYKFYKRPVFGIYFAHNVFNIDTQKGSVSWESLPLEPEPPAPFDPKQVPVRNDFWTDNDQIYYFKYNGIIIGGIEPYREPHLGLPPLFRLTRYLPEKMAILPGSSHMLFINLDGNIEIQPLTRPLTQSFLTSCLEYAPKGDACVSLVNDRLSYSVLKPRKTNEFLRSKELTEVKGRAEVSWNNKKAERFAIFSEGKALAYDAGSLIFAKEFQEPVYLLKWLSDRFLAVQIGSYDLSVFDVETGKRVFVAPDQYDYSSMFEIPIDYSAVANRFIFVGKQEDNTPVLEIWDPDVTQAFDIHKFTDPDMEWAQTIRFRDDGKLFMIGFHHGYVYLVKDVTKKLGEGNLRSMKDHQDMVFAVGYLDNGARAYTMSDDGTATLHNLAGSFESHNFIKTKTSNSGGWLPGENHFWMLNSDSNLRIFDVSGRLLESAYLSTSRLDENVAFLDTYVGRIVFLWKNFDVWQDLCLWSPYMARLADEELQAGWNTCNPQDHQ